MAGPSSLPELPSEWVARRALEYTKMAEPEFDTYPPEKQVRLLEAGVLYFTRVRRVTI